MSAEARRNFKTTQPFNKILLFYEMVAGAGKVVNFVLEFRRLGGVKRVSYPSSTFSGRSSSQYAEGTSLRKTLSDLVCFLLILPASLFTMIVRQQLEMVGFMKSEPNAQHDLHLMDFKFRERFRRSIAFAPGKFVELVVVEDL